MNAVVDLYNQPEADPKTAKNWEEYRRWLMDTLERISTAQSESFLASPAKEIALRVSTAHALDFKRLAYATTQYTDVDPDYTDGGHECFETPFCRVRLRVDASAPRDLFTVTDAS